MLVLVIPELAFVFFHEKPTNVKWVDNCQNEVSFVHPSRTQSLRYTILAQVDLVVIREIPHRIPDVQHQHVCEHEHSVKDVQWPLVSGKVSVRTLENFDDPKDVPAGDDGAADVHEVQNSSKILALLFGFRARFGSEQALANAAPVEEAFERDKEEE